MILKRKRVVAGWYCLWAWETLTRSLSQWHRHINLRRLITNYIIHAYQSLNTTHPLILPCFNASSLPSIFIPLFFPLHTHLTPSLPFLSYLIFLTIIILLFIQIIPLCIYNMLISWDSYLINLSSRVLLTLSHSFLLFFFFSLRFTHKSVSISSNTTCATLLPIHFYFETTHQFNT